MIWYKKILYFFCTTCRPNTSKTVRFAFPLVMGAIVLGALTATSQNGTFVEIVSSQTNVRAGETVELDVYVSANTPVNAVDIEVAIPDSQLEVTGIDTGESVITLWTEDPYYENGIAHLTGGTFRRGFIGRHLIATINAKAIDTGLAYVNVTESLLLAGDGTADEVQATPSDSEQVKLYIGDENGVLVVSDSDNPSAFEASVSIRIVTDIDGDGDVSLNDVSRFMSAWRSKSTIFDFSGDGKMTFRDFAIILAHTFLR